MRDLNAFARRLEVSASPYSVEKAADSAESEKLEALRNEVSRRLLAAPYGPDDAAPMPALLPYDAEGLDEPDEIAGRLGEAHREALFSGLTIMDDELRHEILVRQTDLVRQRKGGRAIDDPSWWRRCSGLPDEDRLQDLYLEPGFQRRYYIAFLEACRHLGSSTEERYAPRSPAEAFALSGIVAQAITWLEIRAEESGSPGVDSTPLEALDESGHGFTCALCRDWDLPDDADAEDLRQMVRDWFIPDDGSDPHPLLWEPSAVAGVLSDP